MSAVEIMEPRMARRDPRFPLPSTPTPPDNPTAAQPSRSAHRRAAPPRRAATLRAAPPVQDAGMDVNGVRTLEDVLASGAAPLQLDAAQMIDIMDGLMARKPPRGPAPTRSRRRRPLQAAAPSRGTPGGFRRARRPGTLASAWPTPC